jgi:hypothetical protein
VKPEQQAKLLKTSSMPSSPSGLKRDLLARCLGAAAFAPAPEEPQERVERNASVASSQCTHSCKLAASKSQLSRSVWSTSTTSTAIQSHKSYKLPGNILTDLKQSKTISRTPRPAPFRLQGSIPTKIASASPQFDVALPRREKKTLAGNILADFRNSPSEKADIRAPVWVRDFLTDDAPPGNA